MRPARSVILVAGGTTGLTVFAVVVSRSGSGAGCRADHHMAIQIGALGPGGRSFDLLHGGMDDPALIGVHRLE